VDAAASHTPAEWIVMPRLVADSNNIKVARENQGGRTSLPAQSSNATRAPIAVRNQLDRESGRGEAPSEFVCQNGLVARRIHRPLPNRHLRQSDDLVD
jgi:hypothetical protein